MSNYADIETEKSLKALEKQIYQEYSRAYEEMTKTADQYFDKLQDRYAEEYEAYQRGEYSNQEFKMWYKTQIERGQGYNHMRDQLAERMVNANQVASAYINDKTPSIYSLNYNHEAYRIEGAHPSVRFDIYDEQTVRKLMEGDNAVEFKTVNPNPVRDYNWNREQITSALTSGILQGKSISEISDSFLTVMERNRTASMRNARTAYTSAQNAGRQESYKRASQMGIKMMKEWLATTDERTRASHGAMDGERVETDQAFSNELMYPADPDGAPEEVYNCRCTMFAVLPDVNDEKRETYSDWIKRKEEEMSDREAKSSKERELKKAIERWNASHYSGNTLNNYDDIIRSQWRDEMLERYGIDVHGLEEMHIDYYQQAMEEISSVLNEFPKAQNFIDEIKPMSSDDLNGGWAEFGYYGNLNINTFMYGDKEIESDFLDLVRYNLSVGNKPIDIISHELGHLADRAYLGTGSSTKEWYNHKSSKAIMKEARKRLGITEKQQDDILTYMSKRATDNVSEGVAECFADVRSNGINATPLSKTVYEILKEKLS